MRKVTIKLNLKLATDERENDENTRIISPVHTLIATSSDNSDGSQRHLLPNNSLPKKLPFSNYYRNKSKFKSPDKDDKPEIYRIFERIKNKRNEKLNAAKVPSVEERKTSSTEIKPPDPVYSGNQECIYYGCRPKIKSAPKHIFRATERPKIPENSIVANVEKKNEINSSVSNMPNDNMSKISKDSVSNIPTKRNEIGRGH